MAAWGLESLWKPHKNTRKEYPNRIPHRPGGPIYTVPDGVCLVACKPYWSGSTSLRGVGAMGTVPT